MLDQPNLTQSQLLTIAKETLPAYIETAKSFAQISAAALGLTVVFREKILGDIGKIKRDLILFSSWLCFLVSIGASAIYQWAAVKWLDYRIQSALYEKLTITPSFPNCFGGPHMFYGAMLISFMIGALLLVVASARRLLQR